MPTIITFNSKAADFINSDGPPGASKVRVDARFKPEKPGLLLRPTIRKVAPHLMLPLTPRGKGYVVEIDDAVLEKMHKEGMPTDFLQAGERYSVIDATYGWLILLPGDDHEAVVGTAAVSTKK
jgi:hypothetical protein